MEQRCPALAFHRPVRNRPRSIYGAPRVQRHVRKQGSRGENLPRLGAASASTCQHGAINAEDPVTSPPRRQSFSQFAGIARSDSQSSGWIIIICKRSAPLGPTYPITLAGSLGSEQELAPQNQALALGFRQKPRATSLGCSLRAATMVVRYSPTSDRCGVPGRGWSYRPATAVVISRVSGGSTLTGRQGRQAFIIKGLEHGATCTFDTRLISASVRWRTEGFRLRRLQPKAGCSAPEIIRRTANLAQSYYEFVTLDYLRST